MLLLRKGRVHTTFLQMLSIWASQLQMDMLLSPIKYSNFVVKSFSSFLWVQDVSPPLYKAEMFNSEISYQYQYQPTQWGSYQYQLLSTQLEQRTNIINSTWVALINLSTPYQLVFLSRSSSLKNLLDFANFINHEWIIIFWSEGVRVLIKR